MATGVTSVSAGGSHTLFVKTDGSLWAMGGNRDGQLGDGSTIDRSTPIQVATGVTFVSASQAHTLFVKTDGSLWAMGLNNFSQLGDGSTIDRSTPIQVATGGTSASAGTWHTLFVKNDGSLWAVGYNYNGQLGDGTAINRSTPIQVATGVASVSTGSSHTLLVKTDGSIWAVGDNAFGQLGIGSRTDALIPVQIAVGAVAIDAGEYHSMLLASTAVLPPLIVSQFTSATSTYGATPRLTVRATGSAPLTYQWYRGPSGDTSSPLAGATEAGYTTAPLAGTSSFWVRVSNSASSADSATITLSVPPAGYLAAWAAAAGLTGAAAAPLADPEGDGLTNLLECALATPPRTAVNPACAWPTVTTETSGSERVLVFTHRRSKAAMAAGLTFTYQTSTELVTWSPATATPVVTVADVDVDGAVELVRVAIPAGHAPRLHARLVVGIE